MDRAYKVFVVKYFDDAVGHADKVSADHVLSLHFGNVVPEVADAEGRGYAVFLRVLSKQQKSWAAIPFSSCRVLPER